MRQATPTTPGKSLSGPGAQILQNAPVMMQNSMALAASVGSSRTLPGRAETNGSAKMVAGEVKWQCMIGHHFMAPLWADCGPIITTSLEEIWTKGDITEVGIRGWANYTFALSIQGGQKTLVQRSAENGTERRLRRIIIMTI